MARLNVHPAPGFGQSMLDGWLISQRPMPTRGTPLVPSLQATAPGRAIRKARLSELMPGGFTVPQNPLRMALGGLRDLMPGGFSVPQNPLFPGGMGGMGCGCSSGCGTGTANYTLNGLGDNSVPVWAQYANTAGHRGISTQMRAAVPMQQARAAAVRQNLIAAARQGGAWRT